MSRMPRPQSPSSDTGDDINDMMLQEELERLRNQLRLLEDDRKKYAKEINVECRSQRELIERLEAENKELNTWMGLVESDYNEKRDNENLKRLVELRDEYDTLVAKIDTERQKSQTLDVDIRKMEKKKWTAAKARGGKGRNSSGREGAMEKKTRMTENRLDNCQSKYGNVLERNRELRIEISKLSNARDVFTKVYGKCEKQLEEYRQEIQEITEQTIQAYEQRDEANNKTLALKEKNDKDEAQFEHEKRDLQRIIDHDRRLRDFMNIKSNERIEWKKKEEERRRRHGSAGERARQQQQLQIETYEEAFHRIEEITNEEDLDQIVADFIRNEDNNFALFQYVRELNNQGETLNDDIEQIKLNIESFEEEEVRLEKERENIIRGIEEETTAITGQADRAAERLTEVRKILDQLNVGVSSVFDKVRCDPSALREMLGQDEGVTETTIMQYLGAVEQRTNELLRVQLSLQVKAYRDGDRDDQPEYGLTLGLSRAAKGGRELTMDPPMIGDDLADIDEEEGDEPRPFSQHELRSRIVQRAQRRGSAHRTGGASRSFERRGKK